MWMFLRRAWKSIYNHGLFPKTFDIKSTSRDEKYNARRKNKMGKS